MLRILVFIWIDDFLILEPDGQGVSALGEEVIEKILFVIHFVDPGIDIEPVVDLVLGAQVDDDEAVE
jgi:hypothetical protein